MNVAIFDKGPPPPCPTPFNLADYVLAQGFETPDKIALAVLGLSRVERWSYRDLIAAVRGTATGLLNTGLRPGDRVLMRLGHSVAFPITYLAALAVDLIPVPTSAQLTAFELDKIVTEISPSLIVAEDGITLPHRFDCPLINGPDLLAMRALPPADFVYGDPNRAGYIIFTSGTSGVARAVTHAHRAIWARRMMWNDWYGLQQNDRMLHAGAFNWTYTLGTGLLDPWTIGATALIPDHGISPQQLPLLLKRHDATIFAAAPGVYRQMLRANVPVLPKLRHGLSAGEKLPHTTHAKWVATTGTEIHEAFGLSECSTFISGNPHAPSQSGTIGRPQTGRRVAILNDDVPANPGVVGRLAIRTDDPGLMLGYWSNSLDGPKPIETDWFDTGDTAAMSSNGDITYFGRDDDMMNAGGFRVSPIEVETAMNAHPHIQECAAVELSVKGDASIIAVFYVSATTETPDDLNRFAADHLARYKCPRHFQRVDVLPKGANGKLLRRELRNLQKVDNG